MQTNQKNTRKIDGIEVVTTTAQFGAFEVEVGTNGFHGGGPKDGGRTYIRLQGCDGADVRVRRLPGISAAGLGVGIEIICGGNKEFESMLGALNFVIETLENDSKTQFLDEKNIPMPENKKRTIDGIEILTFQTEIENFNYLEVEVGTNDYRYKKNFSNVRTYLRVQDRGGTFICTEKLNGKDQGAEVILAGDAELLTVATALYCAALTLLSAAMYKSLENARRKD